ncbi:MAG: fumarylacetoacetate hydrolase family protein [Solirubrobacteraceae bacterium]
MRLITYTTNGAGSAHVGELLGDHVRELAAPSMIAWLNGEGHGATGVEHAIDDVTLLAPVPAPPAYRDFMTYKGHAERALRNIARPDFVLADYWYEVPGFYFGNPATIVGPDQPVRRPEGVERLDYELELAAVVGADEQLAGFTILNDWSARDVQSREAALGGLGIKAKDFATSLGPWLVTPDELPYENGRLRVSGRVEVNSTAVTQTSTQLQHFDFEQMRRHAARDSRLRAGDVLATGTLDYGCIAELGPPTEQRWLQPGDRVALIVDGLGELRNTIE